MRAQKRTRKKDEKIKQNSYEENYSSIVYAFVGNIVYNTETSCLLPGP